MADIFISYSSKDREKAEQLIELLASAGLSVWIDRTNIGFATSWSGEIVDAIEGCKALLVLLSQNSIESANVIKEVALASEKKKKILPLELEPVTLPRDLQYHLAGIQRAPMTNIDAIIRALGRLGFEATQAPSIKLVKETDTRKSLMILPFEDLSPTADNGWFADGIVNELISSLSNVKSLRVTDQQTTKEYKAYKGHMTAYAKEMSIRYFLQGDVRKFGDQIKISCTLLDIETGDHLWQDSHKGTMEDIFDIQETVAKKVVGGLSVALTKEEEKELDKRPTENTEAYELYLKGQEYYVRQTKDDFERAISLFEEAIRLDPLFVDAYGEIAYISQQMYRTYDMSPHFLDRAAEATEKVRELEGESAQYYSLLSAITLQQGDKDAAYKYAKRSVETDPNYAFAHHALGIASKAVGKHEESANAMEAYALLRGNNLTGIFNYVNSLYDVHDPERIKSATEMAIPIFERHIRLNPDDYVARANLTAVHTIAGNMKEAVRIADELSLIDSLDGFAHAQLSFTYLIYNDHSRCLEQLRRAVAKGFRDLEIFRSDPSLDPLRDNPEFQELMQELEEKVAKEKNG